MTVLVTGAGGFIGQHLVEELAKRGHAVKAMVRPGSRLRFNSPNVQIVYGDVQHKDFLTATMEGCSSIYHLAAYVSNRAKDMNIYARINVDGFRNVVEAAKEAGVKKIVLTSTAGTYGAPAKGMLVSESTIPDPSAFNIYESTKYEAEQIAKEFSTETLKIIIVNPTRIFGPGQAKISNVGKIIQNYSEGKWRIVLGSGYSIANYGFVADVVRGHILAMEHGRPGENYILGGENLSYLQFFAGISEVTGKKRQMLHLPYWLAWLIAAAMTILGTIIRRSPPLTPKWLKRYIEDRGADIGKARSELGYSITPFKDAVKITLDKGLTDSPK